MQLENVGQQLFTIIDSNVEQENRDWLDEKINKIIDEQSTRDLYLTYSLIASKIKPKDHLNLSIHNPALKSYLEIQDANIQQLSRIYLLVRVLEANSGFFTSKVANIIQVADTNELETFLRFLVLLPDAHNYKNTAVDSLRTNIAGVFDAIALKNPYPALFFNDQQWNQMYLKAAFMERNLSEIVDVDGRANKELTRIISDYAHERWAASRKIDPFFWHPVTKFLEAPLIKDMEHLLTSSDPKENNAGALCCYNSGNQDAMELLEKYPELLNQVENKNITWKTLIV